MTDIRDLVSPEEHTSQMVVQSSASSDRDSCLRTAAGQLWCFAQPHGRGLDHGWTSGHRLGCSAVAASCRFWLRVIFCPSEKLDVKHSCFGWVPWMLTIGIKSVTAVTNSLPNTLAFYLKIPDKTSWLPVEKLLQNSMERTLQCRKRRK